MQASFNHTLRFGFHASVVLAGLAWIAVYADYRFSGFRQGAPPTAAVSSRAAADGGSGAAGATTSAIAAQPPSTRGGKPEVWTNFEDGLKAPIGEELDRFKSYHADAECVENDGPTRCELKSLKDQCPSDLPCLSVTYTFKWGFLNGFYAAYDSETFQTLKAKVTEQLGPGTQSVVSPSPPGRTSATVTRWRTDEGTFGFSRFVGADPQGQPLKAPYMVVLSENPPINADATTSANSVGGSAEE